MRMSAYAGQMECGFSAQALSSKGNSEMGSRYMESGFYMSSFAATIFIAGLVTVGVLLISLLVSLAVMLQSCESRNKGIVERQMTNIDYDYCKISSLNAELNGLLLSDLPSTCKRFSDYQASHHQYERDLNLSLLLVERYFGSIQPSDDGVDVILMDVDDILPPERFHHYDCRDCLKQENDSKNNLVLSLYTKLRGDGWSMILLSRKEKHCNSTVQNLISAGFQGWWSEILRSGDELQMDVNQYFARRRASAYLRHNQQPDGCSNRAISGDAGLQASKSNVLLSNGSDKIW